MAVGEPGAMPQPSSEQFEIGHAVLDRIGVGLEPLHMYLYRERPSLEQLERWVLDQVGGSLEHALIEDANGIAAGVVTPPRLGAIEQLDAVEPVLSAEDLALWDERGYVIVPRAAPSHACAELCAAIYAHIGAMPDAPESWYGRSLQQGIMVQLFHAPGIAEIHASPRIRKAFAQLAGTSDLVMSSDRCGFNPPVRPGDPYGGTGLHLDLPSFELPVVSHLQGILYLTETSASQGAFRCVPGFHRRIDDWIRSLPEPRHPELEDLEPLGPVPIAAGGGDLIIWDARLPHGPQANTSQQPRLVHYVRMYPRPRRPSGAAVTQ